MFLLAVLSCLLVLSISTTTSRSSKKGVCVPPGSSQPGSLSCGDLEALTGVSWWYNWHVDPKDEGLTCGAEVAFVPMIWGYHEVQSTLY